MNLSKSPPQGFRRRHLNTCKAEEHRSIQRISLLKNETTKEHIEA